jgi:hypothetical protein
MNHRSTRTAFYMLGLTRAERDHWHRCAIEREENLATCIRAAVRQYFSLDRKGRPIATGQPITKDEAAHKKKGRWATAPKRNQR